MEKNKSRRDLFAERTIWPSVKEAIPEAQKLLYFIDSDGEATVVLSLDNYGLPISIKFHLDEYEDWAEAAKHARGRTRATQNGLASHAKDSIPAMHFVVWQMYTKLCCSTGMLHEEKKATIVGWQCQKLILTAFKILGDWKEVNRALDRIDILELYRHRDIEDEDEMLWALKEMFADKQKDTP